MATISERLRRENGPKGMAFAGFLAEKDAALALARGEK